MAEWSRSDWPPDERCLLKDVRVPACLLDPAAAGAGEDGLIPVDVAVEGDGIVAVTAATEAPDDDAGVRQRGALDLCDWQLWPAYVDAHTHLDKTHTASRTPNADGSFEGAIEAERWDRERYWSPDDLRRRMDFALRSAYAHGTVALRTHLVSSRPWRERVWRAFSELRESWAGRMELQGVSLVRLDELAGEEGAGIADFVAANAGVLGCAILRDDRGIASKLDAIFALAAERGLDLDFHADENGDPDSQALKLIAEAALRARYDGKVTVGHCCSLAVQDDAAVDETLDRVARAGLGIVCLPQTNLVLQDRREGRTPRWRGLTLVHELHAREIPVALASDNCRDYWNPFGDYDLHAIFSQAVMAAQLDRSIADWPAAVTAVPAALMGLPGRGLVAPGAPADFLLFPADDWYGLISRPQADRIVVRGGRPIDARAPEFRELQMFASGAAGNPAGVERR